MSQKNDMLGPITRALVGVPQSRLSIVADVANKLAADGGDNFHKDLAEFLRTGMTVKVVLAVDLPVWRKVKLGTGFKNTQELFTELRNKNCEVHPSAKQILRSPGFKLAEKPEEIELVEVSLSKLGFSRMDYPTLGCIYERASKLGLGLCPSEVGPQLRLQYQDQRDGESVYVAMSPVIGASEIGLADGKLMIFSLSAGNPTGCKWLWGEEGTPRIDLFDKIVFTVHKPVKR